MCCVFKHAVGLPCSDIFDWLDLRKNHGKEEARCRDLFYGLWINDLFMQARSVRSLS